MYDNMHYIYITYKFPACGAKYADGELAGGAKGPRQGDDNAVIARDNAR